MSNKRGFTLVELLIVVLILAALAAIAIPRVTQSAQTAKLKSCAANLSIMNSQIELNAANNNGTYISSLSTITSDPNYFPDGTPVCSLGGTYSLGSNHRVTCNHSN